jgi:hypothetical protein
MNGIFKIGWNDLLKGLIMVVGGALVTYVSQLTSLPGFDGSIDWNQIVRIALVTGVTYIGKQLLTDNNEKVLGVIPTK